MRKELCSKIFSSIMSEKNLALKASRLIICIPIVLFSLLCYITNANAIPVFARKYEIACQVCHIAPPILNNNGRAFRLNGYRFPTGDRFLVKDVPVKMGSKSLRKIRDVVWPSTLPGLPPIAIRFFGDATHTPQTTDAKTNFNFPAVWRILSSGTFDEHISYFMSICFASNDTTSITIPFQAQILYNDVFNEVIGDDTLNVRFGLIDIRNLDWNNKWQHLILTDYLYATTKAPIPATITNRNDFAFFTNLGGSPGIELNGLTANKRLYWAAAINHGDDFGTFDDNTGKDWQVILRYKLGGLPYGVSEMQSSLQTAGKESSLSFWERNSLAIGGLYYNGSAEVETATTKITDHFWRAGLDLRFQHGMEYGPRKGSWEVRAGALLGTNNHPWGSLSTEDGDFESFYIEGKYLINQWLIPALRYETVDWNDPSDVTFGSVDKQRFVPHVSIRIRQNLRIAFEANFYTENDEYKSATDANTFIARYDIAF